MVVFKVATDIDGSLVTSFRPSNIIQLQTVSFQQGENLKVCNEIAPVYLTTESSDHKIKRIALFSGPSLDYNALCIHCYICVQVWLSL